MHVMSGLAEEYFPVRGDVVRQGRAVDTKERHGTIEMHAADASTAAAERMRTSADDDLPEHVIHTCDAEGADHWFAPFFLDHGSDPLHCCLSPISS